MVEEWFAPVSDRGEIQQAELSGQSRGRKKYEETIKNMPCKVDAVAASWRV